MTSWDALNRELDLWVATGRPATLWWRDDDAVRVTPELERVLALSAATETPVALAVIPRDADAGLAHRLSQASSATVLQHGFAHANHAGADDRQNEYGPERPLAVRIAELAEGWRRLLPFPRRLPVLVAPWNRLSADLPPALAEAGLAGLSALGARPQADPAPGVRQVNVHVDIMNWQSRRFAGLTDALGQLVGHLRARREGRADAGEATGVMTHHAFHDEEAWTFIADLIGHVRSHGGAAWLPAGEVFWP
ncbi:MAG: hypothetical protein U1E66_04600 [Rhodospirillales bacterium]